MALSVAMPLTLRLDARTAREGRDRVDAAVRAAYARAATRAAAALADRGDYLVLDLAEPTLRFSGAGLTGLDEDDRLSVAGTVRAAILDAAARHLHAPGETEPAEPLRPGEGAVPEPGRMILGAYRAPSYETGYETGPGERPPDQIVFVVSREGFARAFPRGFYGDLYSFVGVAQLTRAFRATLASARAQGAEPPTGLVGGLYGDRGPDGMTNWIVLGRYGGDPDALTVSDRFALGGPTSVVVDDREGVTARASAGFSVVGVATYRRLPGEGDAETRFRETMTAEAMSKVAALAAARRLPADAVAELRRIVREAVGARVADSAGSSRRLNPGRRLTLIRFDDGEGGQTLGLGPDVFGSGPSIPVYPIVFANYDPSRQIPDGGGGEGGGSGGGAGRPGEGQGRRGGGEPGGSEEGQGPGGGRIRFPVSTGGETVEIDLSAFNGELSYDELGEIGALLKDLMKRIAFRLDMPEGDYPGAFLIAAAQVWGGRAGGVSGFEGARSVALRRREGEDGALGDVDFVPPESPALALLRHLGATVPLMTRMARLLWDAYQVPGHAARLRGYERGDGVSWHLHFLYEYAPAMNTSIAFGFKSACKACLIPLLLASRQEILLRLDNFERYWPMVEALLIGLVAPQARLEVLRRRLNAWIADNRPTTAAVVATGYASWREAREALQAAFGTSESAAVLQASTAQLGRAATEGTVELTEDDRPAIRDGTGRLWTLQDLDQAIALRAGTARAIDPLVHKIADLPQAVLMADQTPMQAKAYLRALLEEMRDANIRTLREAEGPAEYAFRASKIHEDIRRATVPGTTVAMGGVHLLAHQAIGASFAGDGRYGEGVDYAFTVELGRQGLVAFFEFTGVLFLSVVCPPLGAAAGAVLAGMHLHEAHRGMDVTRGLMDEDQVLSLAEAELDLFLAEMEAAFSFIPLGGKVVRYGSTGIAAVARRGVRSGARRVARRISADVAREMAAQLRHGVAVAFVRELASDQMMGQLVQHAMTPLIGVLMHELNLASGASGRGSEADVTAARTALARALDDRGAGDAAPTEGAEAARRGNP